MHLAHPAYEPHPLDSFPVSFRIDPVSFLFMTFLQRTIRSLIITLRTPQTKPLHSMQADIGEPAGRLSHINIAEEQERGGGLEGGSGKQRFVYSK